MLAHKMDKSRVTVALAGDLDHKSAVNVREDLDKILQNKSVMELALDCKNITFMDSSGLGVIIGRYKKMTSRGGEVLVLNVPKQVDKLFSLSGMYSILKKG